ncbi:MAG: ATP-binding protein [Pseudonocardiales bacterium]|nr:ATP-binding protein [Pseudonocardiales bacterium]PZS21890.1 MAG: ATP-binding protein [Pseudonocardiales bacterium]
MKSSPEAGRSPAKIIVAGSRGVGKTTFVGSVSDTDPITVEAATDIGRITLHPDLVLYLFGTSEAPQSGFGGALGAVVLVDARRIEDAFATISYFEDGGFDVPFLVAVNMFDGELRYELDELREALAVRPDVPLTTCDARDPASTAKTLQELVSYTMNGGGSDHTSPPELPG